MQQNRFWLSLIGLCIGVACGFAFALALISASTAIAFASRQDRMTTSPATQEVTGKRKVLTGVVTDSYCGAQHVAANRSAAECAKDCISKGAKYVLVDGNRVYELQGDAADVNKLAGQRVQVVGLVEGDVLTVNSIALAQ